MYECRVGARGKLVAEDAALVPVSPADSYFDQLVRGQRALDFGHELRADPGMSDLHDRFQRVRTRLQVCALAGRQCRRHHAIVAPASYVLLLWRSAAMISP
jgi:hypothetical protein